MIDTHAHLHDPKYDTDRKEVIEQMFKNGVDRVITVGDSVEGSQQAIELAHQYNDIFATAGLHPYVFNEIAEDDTALEQLRSMVGNIAELAQDDKVVAIGEIGLDYYSHADLGVTPKQKLLQITGLKEQLKVAQNLSLPLVIHCRDAYNDCYSVLDKMNMLDGDIPVIFHCYGGDLLFTKRLLQHNNVYFSFTGNITYPVKKSIQGTKDDIQESLRIIPLNRILTETDCPYLAPQEKRGSRNVSENVRYVYEKIAGIHERDLEEIVQQVKKNVQSIYPSIYVHT